MEPLFVHVVAPLLGLMIGLVAGLGVMLSLGHL
jgi:hypothetical protein